MKRILTVVALFAVALGLGSAAFAATTSVGVVNCSNKKLLVCTFDGDDKNTNDKSDRKVLKVGEKEVLTCDDGGKGGCWLKVAYDTSSTCQKHKGELFDDRVSGYYRVNGNDEKDLEELADKAAYDALDCTKSGDGEG